MESLPLISVPVLLEVQYPFNHLCPSERESDVEAWVYDNAGQRSPSITVHLDCSAPCEVVTPFFQNAPYSSFTWDDVSSSPQSCNSTAIAR